MSIIPNVSPKVFSFSAVVVGYLLIDDLTANEQNALGNWLMLTAQVLCTNAFYKQVQADRGITNANTSSSATENMSEPTTKETIQMLKKMVYAMQREIEELKKTKF